MNYTLTLEDVRAMVMFKLLDQTIPEGFDWVAVDPNGQIGVFKESPTVDPIDPCWTSAKGVKMFMLFLDMPEEYHWQDLVFKL